MILSQGIGWWSLSRCHLHLSAMSKLSIGICAWTHQPQTYWLLRDNCPALETYKVHIARLEEWCWNNSQVAKVPGFSARIMACAQLEPMYVALGFPLFNCVFSLIFTVFLLTVVGLPEWGFSHPFWSPAVSVAAIVATDGCQYVTNQSSRLSPFSIGTFSARLPTAHHNST